METFAPSLLRSAVRPYVARLVSESMCPTDYLLVPVFGCVKCNFSYVLTCYEGAFLYTKTSAGPSQQSRHRTLTYRHQKPCDSCLFIQPPVGAVVFAMFGRREFCIKMTTTNCIYVYIDNVCTDIQLHVYIWAMNML